VRGIGRERLDERERPERSPHPAGPGDEHRRVHGRPRCGQRHPPAGGRASPLDVDDDGGRTARDRKRRPVAAGAARGAVPGRALHGERDRDAADRRSQRTEQRGLGDDVRALRDDAEGKRVPAVLAAEHDRAGRRRRKARRSPRSRRRCTCRSRRDSRRDRGRRRPRRALEEHRRHGDGGDTRDESGEPGGEPKQHRRGHAAQASEAALPASVPGAAVAVRLPALRLRRPAAGPSSCGPRGWSTARP